MPDRSHRRRLTLSAGALVIAVLVGLLGGGAYAGEQADPSLPANDAARGMVYSGLLAAKDGPCAGMFQVKGVTPAMCTHGPDPAPAGLSVKRSVQPIAAAAAGASALAVCEGDGTSGRRVEVLYIHGSTSRYNQYLETFLPRRGRRRHLQRERPGDRRRASRAVRDRERQRRLPPGRTGRADR
ncbi:hypothetical protein ACFQ1L_26675 [Phytohabitans flavus]|uniref:hypothetical protein n=1 Tax=Phytohabitans flavus TaxID=1076124 RepID=UPI00363C26AB